MQGDGLAAAQPAFPSPARLRSSRGRLLPGLFGVAPAALNKAPGASGPRPWHSSGTVETDQRADE